MKLLRATFLGVRGLPDLTCDFSQGQSGVARDLIVITGPPSSGKTRLLEALLTAKEVIAPYGPPVAAEPWIRPGAHAAKIELTFLLDQDETRRAGGSSELAHAEAIFGPTSCRYEVDDGVMSVLERYEHDPRFGKVDYFAANRQIPPPGPAHGTTSFEQRIYRTTRDPRKYAFIPRLLLDLGADAAAGARFAQAIERLGEGLLYVGPSAGDALRCFSSGGKPPASLYELSTTESEAVLFAASATLLHYKKSILFIDRPELSADERRIVAWIKAVRELGSDAQVIVASSSPALLSGVEPGAWGMTGATS
jgi:hypothetical protein